MLEFIEKLKNETAKKEFLKKHRLEPIDPPENLNPRWFSPTGQPSDELQAKYAWLINHIRGIAEVVGRIGDYFKIVDIFVIGGQAKAGGSIGDLDLYVWLKDTMRPLYMTSDERDLRRIISAAINNLPHEMEIAQMIATKGKPNFVDVFISTVRPQKAGTDINSNIYYSFKSANWVDAK